MRTGFWGAEPPGPWLHPLRPQEQARGKAPPALAESELSPLASPSSRLETRDSELAGPGAEKQTGPGRWPLDLLQFSGRSFGPGAEAWAGGLI